MNVIFNDKAQQWEANTTGTLLSIQQETRNLKNDKATPYRLCTAEITYPDGSKDKITASLWAKSLELHKDKFTVGSLVGVAINVDPNSEYQGNAKLSLPSNRANVSKLLQGMKLPAGMVATKQVADKA